MTKYTYPAPDFARHAQHIEPDNKPLRMEYRDYAEPTPRPRYVDARPLAWLGIVAIIALFVAALVTAGGLGDMKFNLPETENQPDTNEPQIGYVYRARGGNLTRFWCVVALSETGNTVHLLGLDAKGNPVSTSSYNRRSIEDRAVVGIVDLNGLEFDVRPIQ